MGKIVVFMSMSLDGFVAGADDGPEQGLGVGGEVLHGWLGDGGADPASYRPADPVNAEVFDELMTTGAVLTGRHTFEYAGEWGGDHHDDVPVFVLTRRPPEPATTGNIHYVSDPATAAASAREAAGERDVMMHGASAVQSLLSAGLIDELAVTLVPVLLGRGRPLFDDASATLRRLELISAREGAGVLQLRYRVTG